MFLEASYIGNKGTRLPHNPQFLGPRYNMNTPTVLKLGASVLQVGHQLAGRESCRNRVHRMPDSPVT